MEKYYKNKILEGNTMYEAEMFYIPYFQLEKGVLKCVSEEVPNKFKWLKDLCRRTKVYYDIKINHKQGTYYTLKDRFNIESFYKDFHKGTIINEY